MTSRFHLESESCACNFISTFILYCFPKKKNREQIHTQNYHQSHIDLHLQRVGVHVTEVVDGPSLVVWWCCVCCAANITVHLWPSWLVGRVFLYLCIQGTLFLVVLFCFVPYLYTRNKAENKQSYILHAYQVVILITRWNRWWGGCGGT